MKNVCNSIEEYDPQTNKWREVEEFVEQIKSDIESSEVIRPFTKSDIIWEIEK